MEPNWVVPEKTKVKLESNENSAMVVLIYSNTVVAFLLKIDVNINLQKKKPQYNSNTFENGSLFQELFKDAMDPTLIIFHALSL